MKSVPKIHLYMKINFKFIFTLAALKTSFTELEISGPIPSPGINEIFENLYKFEQIKAVLRVKLEMFVCRSDGKTLTRSGGG